MCNTCKKPNCNCGSNNHSHKRVLATIADIRKTIAQLNAKINEALKEIDYPTLQKVTDIGNTTDNYITFKSILSELSSEDLNKIYKSLTIVQENEVAKILFNTYVDKLEPTSIELSKEGINLNVEDILSLAVTKDQATFGTKVSGLDAVAQNDYITLKQSTDFLNEGLETKVDKVENKSLVDNLQIEKLFNLDDQNILNEKFANLSGKITTELFPIKSSGSMPIPTINGIVMQRAWSLIAEGIYIQIDKPNIVVEENELAIVSWVSDILGYINKYTRSFAVGALTINNTTNDSFTNYWRTSRTNPNSMIETNEEEELFYTGKISNINLVGVIFYDENFNFLGHQFNEINEWIREPIIKPTNTKYIATCSEENTPLIESYSYVSGYWELDQKISVQPSINGQISPIDDRGISGKTIFEFLKNVLNISEAEILNFGLERGQLTFSNNGIPNTSLNWICTTRIPYFNEYGQINISGYKDASGSSGVTLNDNRVFLFDFNGNLLDIISSPSGEGILSFIPQEGTNSFAIQLDAGPNVGADLPNSIFWEKLKIWTGTDISDLPKETTIKGESIVGDINTNQMEVFEKTSIIVDQIVVETKISDPINITTTVGSLTLGGSASQTPSNYRRTSITSTNSVGRYIKGSILSYTGQIEDLNIAAIWFLREDMSKISPIELPIGLYENYEISNIPEDTFYIATCSANVDPIIKNVSVQYQINGSTRGGFVSIYVDIENGNDENDGNSIEPVKSIGKAIDLLSQYNQGIIILNRGDYRETLDLAKLNNGDYKIINKEGHTVRILGSNSINNWEKTNGYQNIYEANLPSAIPNWSRNRNPIFEDGNPSKLINEDDYHPLQKNLRFRLPFTPILSVNSLEILDSTPSSYFVADGKIYIHTTNSDDPETNEFNYEIANRIANTINPASTTNKKVNLYIEGIQFLYHTTQFRLSGFSKTILKNVSALASSGAGAICPNTGYNILIDCEGGYCNGDGFNGHFSAYSGYQSLSDNRIGFPTTHYINCWGHDNFDDGESSHEHHNVIMDNTLLEFNGDSGCRPSNDATYYVRDSIFRDNGWEVGHGGNAGKGEGFSVVNPVSNVNRVGCRAVLFNCLSYRNNTGYATISSQTNIIELINCTSRDNHTAEYYAGIGKMKLRNCRATNADPNKKKIVATGVIIIENDEILV